MFGRMRGQPARVFRVERVVRRAEVSGESTHLSSFTSVLINVCVRNNAHQKVYFKRIDPGSLDVSDCVWSRCCGAFGQFAVTL